MMKSDFPLITRITEARACDDEHLSIRLDVWTDDGQRFVRLSRIAARQLFILFDDEDHPVTVVCVFLILLLNIKIELYERKTGADLWKIPRNHV